MASHQPHNSTLSQNTLASSSRTVVRRISAAERLPVEVLRKIIQLSMVGCVGYLDPAQLPLLLRRVCPEWAAIADSIPRFWSNIFITAPQCLRTNVQVIRDWLRRSCNTKLTVGIYAPINIDGALLQTLLAAFLPTSVRWEHLELYIPSAFLSMMLSNADAPLPSLERLKVAIATQPVLTLSPSATCLRQVALVLQPPMGTPHGGLFNLAWSQITSLDIHTMLGTIDVMWNILTGCPRLLNLTITAPHNHATPYIPFFPHNVFHSNLRRLVVFTSSRPGVIGYFLDGLFLPYLQDLRLHFTNRLYDTHIWPSVEILSLRHRALPPLSKLTIAGKTISEADLCDFVLRMRYLEQLDVNDGTTNLVTQAVRDLLPQNDDDIRRQQAAYRQELIARGRL